MPATEFNASGSLSPSSYSIRAVERVCDIFDLLRTAPAGMGFDELVAVTGLPRSSAFRYLATLETRGYVARGKEGGYALGPLFRPLQERQVDELVEVARPLMQQLSQETGETVNLGILRGTRVSYVEIVESQRQVRLAAKAGDRDFIHCTGLGKAIASRLSDEDVRRVLDVEGLPQRTKQTITDAESYFEMLARVRHNGYAVDRGENEVDGCCVAVVVPDLGFDAAVSLSSPASRFNVEQVPEIADRLQQLTRDIAIKLRAVPIWR